jgi:Family of unknown function (DUF5681)
VRGSGFSHSIMKDIAMTKKENDRVGTKRYQFKPGQSGNPSGRPKGARNFRTELLEELAETITLKDAGREVTVSKQRACILLSLCAKLNADAEGSNEELAPDDHEILAAFAEREHGRRQGSPGSDNT